MGELAAHLAHLDQVGAEQRVDGKQVALVDDLDDGPPAVLVALGQVGDHIGHADHRQGELGLITLPGEVGQIDDGHVALGPGGAGAVEHLAVEAVAEQPHGLAHVIGATLPLLGDLRIA